MINGKSSTYGHRHTRYFALLVVLLWAVACNRPAGKDLSPDKEHPMLIKTIGSPNYGNVQSILQDRAGNLWFSTTENGLYKYDGTAFSRFLVADGLPSNNVHVLFEDREGRIWIGTHAGLSLYDGKSFVDLPIPLPKHLPPNTNPYYKDSHWVYDIIQAKNGDMWFATIDGVYVYDGKEFRHFAIDEAKNGFLTSVDKAEHILEDKAGNIWFGGRTNEGVFRYDGKSIVKFHLDTLYQNGPKPKALSWAWPQWQDSQGNIWFSSWGGAYRYDGTSFTRFTKKDGLPGIVTRIIEDRKGNIWFGGDGLSRYDGRSFTTFSAKDGLTNPSVWSILEDKQGDLWIGTRATSLFRFDGKSFLPYSVYKP